MKINISVESLIAIHWYVDASCRMHSGCKGRTGTMITMGACVAMSMSKAHNINIKSSTESEVVGIDDALPDILWGTSIL